MTTALYRRYRPETFGEMIGQAQVTEPLMTALRGDRVGHAYLFSGPRGCGKTTSARILARCLNCAEGPTDTPCGVCDSCVELGRGGGESLDVVEIDAASHNGVDDARDLRERAIFAPARDRFKIFILDEAHMVTPQGFNALLKLVEEPPPHIKFIFATTEPDKVLGTIRSRTHHYPFRLVPPAGMLEYVATLCEAEGVTVEPGVLPLVVRAGGGSPRDTLSLLDQLIAGSEGTVVGYERAVALLGYTHAALLDEVVDAFSASDAAAAFGAVDRVVQTGQDPRRFVDDLLERLRDLIIIAATGQGASAVLRGVPADELERMSRQAGIFGSERLSRTADLVSAALDDMTGATSPRLHLELMVARVLASAGAPAAQAGGSPDDRASDPAVSRTAADSAADGSAGAPAAASIPATAPVAAPAPTEDRPPVRADAAAAQAPAVSEPAVEPTPATASAPTSETAATSEPVPALAGPVTLPRVRDAWPEVLARLENISRPSWLVASNARVLAFEGDVLTVAFQSQSDVAKFKKLNAGAGVSEDLRTAILAVLGVRVKYLARHDSDEPPAGDGPPPPDDDDAPPPPDHRPPATKATERSASERSAPPAVADPQPRQSRPQQSAAPSGASVTEWAVATIPSEGEPDPVASVFAQLAVDDEPEIAAIAAQGHHVVPEREGDVLAEDRRDDVDEPDVDLLGPAAIAPPIARVAPTTSTRSGGVQRVGEAVVRQVLDATFVREEPYEPPTRFN